MLEVGGDYCIKDASNAAEALEQLAHHTFDVALVDLNLPDHDGIWLTRNIRSKWPALPVLILSMRDDEDSVFDALDAGANGFVVKTARQTELRAALTAVHRKGSYFCGEVSESLLKRLRSDHRPAPELTDREGKVLKLLVEGSSNSAIGKALHISVSRVKVHIGALFQKFGVSDRTALAAEAVNRRAISS